MEPRWLSSLCIHLAYERSWVQVPAEVDIKIFADVRNLLTNLACERSWVQVPAEVDIKNSLQM